MTRFDKILWRTNGIIILGGALLGCAGATLIAIKELRHITRDREVTNIATATAEAQRERQLELRYLSAVKGTSLYEASFYADERFDRGYFSKSSTSTLNTCLYDADTKASRWLFPTHRQIIEEVRDLLENPDAPDHSARIVARMTCVIEKDSNGDGRFTSADKKSVYLHDFTGARSVRILEDIDSVKNILQRSPHEILVFTQESGNHFVHHIDIKSGQVTAKAGLPALR